MQLWSQFPKEFLGFNCFCSQTLDIQHFSIAASQYRDYNKYDKHNRNNTNSTQRNKSTQSAKILLWAQWYKKLARSRTFRFSVDISCFTSLFLVAIHFRIATKLTKTAALSLGSADTQPPSQHITSSPCFHWWCPLMKWIAKKRSMNISRVLRSNGKTNTFQPNCQYSCFLGITLLDIDSISSCKVATFIQKVNQGSAPLKCFWTNVGKLPFPCGYSCFLGPTAKLKLTKLGWSTLLDNVLKAIGWWYFVVCTAKMHSEALPPVS